MAGLMGWWRERRQRRAQRAARRPDVGQRMHGTRGRNDSDPGGIAGGGGDGMSGGGF
jgi:hypothetical protein